MGKILLVILMFVIMCIIWTLPVYIATNLLLWLFEISYHMTLPQAFAVSLLLSIIGNMLNNKEG